MASKTAQTAPEKGEVLEESLDQLDTVLDRVKALYEQYFLGIQKQPPTFIHQDIERKIRDLSQLQIRNTALRYRFATLQQKYGAYNTYWRRSLRQMENGTHLRSLSKLGRQAARTGQEIPEEILASMPKRMREQVRRDREAALALERRRARDRTAAPQSFVDDQDMLTLSQGGDADSGEVDVDVDFDPPPKVRSPRSNAHVLVEEDLDLEALLAEAAGDEVTESRSIPTPPTRVSSPAIAAAQQFKTDPGVRPATPRRPFSPDGPATEPTPRAQTPLPFRTTETTPAVRPGTPPPRRVTAPAQAEAQPTEPTPRPGTPPPRRTAPFGAAPRPPAEEAAATERDIGAPTAAPTVPSFGPATRPDVRPGTPPSPFTPERSVAPKLPVVTPVLPSAPSQRVRPNPVAPGALSVRPGVAVDSMTGPFPQIPRPPTPVPEAPRPPLRAAPPVAARPEPVRVHDSGEAELTVPEPPPPGQRTISNVDRRPARLAKRDSSSAIARPKAPPGMTDADVNALYAKYVKAKEMVGQSTGPGAYGRLLETINNQAPKIMEQYKSKGVDFQVVVKDNQVVIRAKPKP